MILCRFFTIRSFSEGWLFALCGNSFFFISTELHRDYLYESTWIFLTALPEGSIMFLNDGSQASASAVLQATEGTDGTHNAAESEGKCSENIER